MPDPWYRGIDISYGPDGGVFISDWTDTGDYHNRTGENRLSGRIYKITYGDAKPSSGSDMTRLTRRAARRAQHPRQRMVSAAGARGVLEPPGRRPRRRQREAAAARSVQLARPTCRGSCARSGRSTRSAAPTRRSCCRCSSRPNEHLRAWGIRHPLRALADRCAAHDVTSRCRRDEHLDAAAARRGRWRRRAHAFAGGDCGADAAGRQRSVEPGPPGARVDDAAACRSVSGSAWRAGLRDAQGRCDRQEPPADGLVRVDSDRRNRPVGARLARRQE